MPRKRKVDDNIEVSKTDYLRLASRYRQSKDKWIQNTVKLEPFDTECSSVTVKEEEYDESPPFVSIEEWIGEYGESNICCPLHVSIEDLGFETHIIPPFESVLLPAKLSGISCRKEAFKLNPLEFFDIFINATGPIWSLALTQSSLTAQRTSQLCVDQIDCLFLLTFDSSYLESIASWLLELLKWASLPHPSKLTSKKDFLSSNLLSMAAMAWAATTREC